jgi:tetratricopeptide (TPR) repeat protein
VRVAVVLFSLALLAWAPAASPAPLQDDPTDPSRMWALVIGISHYVHAEPLQYAAADADAIADFVKSPRGGGVPEDQVFVLTEDEATNVGVLTAIHKLQNKVQRGDTVTVYFAGHGFTLNNTGYFIPIDVTLDTAFLGIGFPLLKSLIENGLAQANTRIFVTDMCYAGRVGAEQSEAASQIQNIINEDLIAFEGGTGNFLNLLASQPYEPSWESEELEQGVFTYALLEALNGSGIAPSATIATASDVVPLVQAEVALYTNNQQNPVANHDFNPGLVMAYLDRPGPEFPPPDLITTLILSNTTESGYQRVEWAEPESESRAVLALGSAEGEVEISPLAPGELELTFFDTEDQPRTVTIELQEGENSLSVDTAEMNFRPAGPIQVAALGPVAFPAPRQLAPDGVDPAGLMLNLEADTDVFVDGQYFGNSGAAEQTMELRGLAPGLHNIQLVIGTDREQRFRVDLFAGLQTLHTENGELLFRANRPPVPTAADVPPTVPVAQVQTYQDFERAVWEGNLITPAGGSASDFYDQLANQLPIDLAEDLRDRLATALGNRAQQTLLKYRRGGDVRWTTEVFEEGSLLTQRVVDLIPETGAQLNANRLFFDGRALAEDGQYALAVQTLEQAIALNAEAAHAHNAIGLSYWQQGLYDTAIPPLQQAIAIAPEWNYPRYTLALVYFQQRLYDLAEQGFQDALANDPDDSTAYHGLAQIYALAGRDDDADAQLQQAVLFNPGNAYAYHTYGLLRQRQGVLDEAEDMLRLATRLEPDEPSFRASLGNLLAATNRPAEADTVFAQAAAAEPTSMPVIMTYREFLESRNRLDEAEGLYERAIEAAPESATLHQIYGAFLLEQERFDDAEDAYDEAIDLDENHAAALTDRATIHLQNQDLDDAIEDLERAIEVDPRFPTPLKALGDIRSAQGQYEDALELYETALESSVEPLRQQELQEIVDETADLLVEERIAEAGEEIEDGDYDDAWDVYVETMAVTPDHPELWNAILQLRYEEPSEADVAELPDSLVADVFATAFWLGQEEAETLWRANNQTEAVQAFAQTLDGLSEQERPLIAGMEFNVNNDLHSIHQVVYRWASRMVELEQYDQAGQLMERSGELNIFTPLPDFSPLTIDSLMVPTGEEDAQEFADFEIRFHPDPRAHEIYAVVAAVTESVDDAEVYFEALEGNAGPDASVRLSVARALDRESMTTEVITILNEVVDNQEQVLARDALPATYVLLAEAECGAGDCDAGIQTLETGLALFPDDPLIEDALDRLR